VAETGRAEISRGGGTLLTTPITVPEEASGDAEDLLTDTPEEIKAEIGSLPGGLDAEVTGPAGFAADTAEVFNDINGTLLYATGARMPYATSSVACVSISARLPVQCVTAQRPNRRSSSASTPSLAASSGLQRDAVW
jgi:hypothetical protein